MNDILSKRLFLFFAVCVSLLSFYDLPLVYFIGCTIVSLAVQNTLYRSFKSTESVFKKITSVFLIIFYNLFFVVAVHGFLSISYGISGGGLGGFGCKNNVGRNIFTHSLDDYGCKWLPWYVEKVTGDDEKLTKWNTCMKNKGNNIAGCALLSTTPFITASLMNGKAPLEVTFSVNYLRTAPIGTLILNYDSPDPQIATSTVVICEEWDVAKTNCLKTNELKHTYSKPGNYPVYYSFTEGPNHRELLGAVHILVTE
jgi:hypothetical protein